MLHVVSLQDQCFGKIYSSILDFTRNYERMSGIFVPCKVMQVLIILLYPVQPYTFVLIHLSTSTSDKLDMAATKCNQANVFNDISLGV